MSRWVWWTPCSYCNANIHVTPLCAHSMGSLDCLQSILWSPGVKIPWIHVPQAGLLKDISKNQEYHMALFKNKKELDESTARRQLKSPQSLPGRSIHLTLVTKWSWSWSWMTYCHLLCAMSISPPILRYNYFKILPWKSMVKVICVVKGQRNIWPSKFKGQGYGQVQTHWSHLRPGVQSICLLFVSSQSDHFRLRYIKFYIWPWKFKVKVMAKVKPDGHIWALEFNRYVCFSFRGNRTIFGWDIANSIFDLENSRSRSYLMVTFES